jgi:thiol-disulfide isomerase/thioredoxin
MAALILKPTLFIHQPKVSDTKPPLLDEAYQWNLKDMDGNRFLLEQHKDKVVFINLWATWCPPCIAEMPDLQKLYNDYKNEMVFLFISNENPNTIKTFMDKKGYTLPAFVPVTQYPADFETNSIPTSFLISKKGEMVMKKSGVAKWDSQKMRKIVDALISQN